MTRINQTQKKKINDGEKKIPDVSGRAKKTDRTTKISEIAGKIPSITGLATIAALTAVKIPNVTSLLKKIDCGGKYQMLKLNILQRLIITNLHMIQLMQR